MPSTNAINTSSPRHPASSAALAAVAGLVAAGAAFAAASPDRDNTAKTGWWYLTNATHADIATKVGEGYRPIDLEPIDGTSPQRFTALFVLDSGSFNKSFDWNTDRTEAQVNSALSTNGHRLIDLEPYETGGVVRYAYASIENSGDDFSPANWWIAGRTEQQVRDFAQSNNARVIDVDTYVEGGLRRYSAVLVPDAGGLARDWTFLADATPAEVSAAIAQGQRVVQIERDGSGTYCVLLEDFAPGVNHHWWFYGWTASQIAAFTDQYGTRLIHLDRQPGAAGDTVFSGAFVNNLNAPETRSRDIMAADISDGFWGFYCKRVNGPIVSALQHDRQFEPASSLKLLHHVTAFLAMQAPGSTTTLNTTFPYLGGGGINQPGYDSCPNPNDPNVQNLQLQTVLSRMMVQSDNEATFTVTTSFGGFAQLNNVASALGMNGTNMQHHIGCGLPPNQVTLEDLGRIHEAVSNGLLSPPNRDSFRTIMINGLSQTLIDIINEEFSAAGLPAFYRPTFLNQVEYATKGGNYGLGGTAYRTGYSWISIPHKSSCQISPREFVYGGYYNQITNDTAAGSQAALSRAIHEQMREQIRAAINSWMSSCIADIDQSGGVGVPDIFAFLAFWFRGDGDFDGDGRTDVPDIFAFLSAWFAS
jgi:hypothetical protein